MKEFQQDVRFFSFYTLSLLLLLQLDGDSLGDLMTGGVSSRRRFIKEQALIQRRAKRKDYTIRKTHYYK